MAGNSNNLYEVFKVIVFLFKIFLIPLAVSYLVNKLKFYRFNPTITFLLKRYLCH